MVSPGLEVSLAIHARVDILSPMVFLERPHYVKSLKHCQNILRKLFTSDIFQAARFSKPEIQLGILREQKWEIKARVVRIVYMLANFLSNVKQIRQKNV